MNGTETYPIVDVMMMVVNVAPIALYFLILGLVNSHARPYLISSRSDFIALTIALAPVLMWPLPTFLQSGTLWPLVAGLIIAVSVFLLLVPRANAGFVIYNISEARCMRILNEALAGMGLTGRWEGSAWRGDRGVPSFHLSKIALLRNVTIHIESDSEAFAARLHAELSERIKAVSQLPSAMGACLVIVGAAIMLVPMWMVGTHIDDLVDAMGHLFG